MRADEFAALKESIRQHGLLERIVLHKGKVLDGRNRLRACVDLGITPKFRDYDGKLDPDDYVLAQNAQRRDLTKSQRAMIAAMNLERFEAAAKERQRVGGRRKGSAKKRDPWAVVQALDALSDTPGKASVKAAEQFSVSARYIEEANAILKTDPKLAKQILDGEVALSDARDLMNRRTTHEAMKKRPAWVKHKKQVMQKALDAKEDVSDSELKRALLKGARNPLERIEAEQIAIGDTVEGRRLIFERATIRQLKFGFGAKVFKQVVEGLETVLAETKTKNHSEVLLHLLKYWKQGHQ